MPSFLVTADYSTNPYALNLCPEFFYRADNELCYEVDRPTVLGNTGHFTLPFQKPGG